MGDEEDRPVPRGCGELPDGARAVDGLHRRGGDGPHLSTGFVRAGGGLGVEEHGGDGEQEQSHRCEGSGRNRI